MWGWLLVLLAVNPALELARRQADPNDRVRALAAFAEGWGAGPEAATALAEATALAGPDAELRVDLARAALAIGRLEDARRLLVDGGAPVPGAEAQAVRDRLAVALERAGRLAEARALQASVAPLDAAARQVNLLRRMSEVDPDGLAALCTAAPAAERPALIALALGALSRVPSITGRRALLTRLEALIATEPPDARTGLSLNRLEALLQIGEVVQAAQAFGDLAPADRTLAVAERIRLAGTGTEAADIMRDRIAALPGLAERQALAARLDLLPAAPPRWPELPDPEAMAAQVRAARPADRAELQVFLAEALLQRGDRKAASAEAARAFQAIEHLAHGPETDLDDLRSQLLEVELTLGDWGSARRLARSMGTFSARVEAALGVGQRAVERGFVSEVVNAANDIAQLPDTQDDLDDGPAAPDGCVPEETEHDRIRSEALLDLGRQLGESAYYAEAQRVLKRVRPEAAQMEGREALVESMVAQSALVAALEEARTMTNPLPPRDCAGPEVGPPSAADKLEALARVPHRERALAAVAQAAVDMLRFDVATPAVRALHPSLGQPDDHRPAVLAALADVYTEADRLEDLAPALRDLKPAEAAPFYVAVARAHTTAGRAAEALTAISHIEVVPDRVRLLAEVVRRLPTPIDPGLAPLVEAASR